jgi:hypothetical protein
MKGTSPALHLYPLIYNCVVEWPNFSKSKLLTAITARVLLAALLLVNVAPAFSSALSSTIGYVSGSSTQANAFSAINVICTSTGLRFLDANTVEQSPGSPQPIHAGSHCPWCALSGPPSLPATSTDLFLYSALNHVEVDSKPTALVSTPIWLQTLARGPPRFSA